MSAEFVRTGEYAGVYVDFAEVGVVDATDVELRLNRADGTTYSTHGQASLLDAVNADDAVYTTGGTVVTLGSRTSGSWDPQAGLWSGASPLAETNPVTVLITLASGEVLSKSIELKSTIRNAGIENDIYPSAPQLTAVSAEFVRTGEYAGVYVDFAEVGVVDATDVELRLNRADGTTYSTHAKAPVLNAVNANNAAYSTGGTVVTLGSRTSSSWEPQVGSWTSASPLAETNPVTVLITLGNGEVIEKSIELKSTIRTQSVENDIYPEALETSAPTISGTAKVGETLNASTGAWTADVTFSYQWFADGVAIAGATSAELLLAPAQWDTAITVEVTGAKPGFVTTTKTSEPTAKVAAAALTAPTPSVRGTAKVGSTLTAVPGTWKAGASTDVTLSYQWYASGTPIAGATESSYSLTAEDAGKFVEVRITGTATGYTTLTKASAASTVKAGKLTAVKPKISGKARVGRTLKAVTGTWKAGTSTKVTLKYRWYANGKAIPKATKSTYKVKAKDKGKKIKVRVTGSAAGYKSLTKTSTVEKIAAGKLTSVKPKIKGKARIGRTLKAVTGTWKAGTSRKVTLKYRWYANGKAIPKATKSTYTVTARDRGKKIKVRVTGSAAGYKSLTKTSLVKKVAR